jgi:tetratricopeptide (TPR) repeat protein
MELTSCLQSQFGLDLFHPRPSLKSLKDMKPMDPHMFQAIKVRARRQPIRQQMLVDRCFALRLAILPLSAALVACIGCRMSAPVYVWKSPPMNHGGVTTIAVGPIGGDLPVAEKLDQAMIASRPQSMPQLAVLYPDQLARSGGIQLVAYDGQPSEMATLGAARRVGANYVLSGHVVQHQLEQTDEKGASKQTWYRFLKRPPPPERMTVRWSLYETATGKRVLEQNVEMNRTDAEKTYPDLAFQPTGDLKVIAACARKSWEMIVPTTYATDASLALPWFSLGSTQVRKGNAYAKLGRWEDAEREWQEAADQHPWNTAAWTNLSIAAVAHEDFELASSRLKHANTTFWPGDETSKTKAWIEKHQREYEASFNPNNAPPARYYPNGAPRPTIFQPFPRNPSNTPPGNPALLNGAEDNAANQVSVSNTKPKSLDEQPWYTVLPFIPPPGWSWKQWWSQPLGW